VGRRKNPKAAAGGLGGGFFWGWDFGVWVIGGKGKRNPSPPAAGREKVFVGSIFSVPTYRFRKFFECFLYVDA